jgi:fructose-1,6-bisphosphatase/inositol monophosphatase family enzyme
MNDRTLASLVGLVINVAILLVFGAAALGYACVVAGVISVCINAAVEGSGGR